MDFSFFVLECTSCTLTVVYVICKGVLLTVYAERRRLIF